MDWYYTNGRSKHGPIDEAGVRLRAEKGYIRPDTLLWHEGLDGWKSASELGFADGGEMPADAGAPPSSVAVEPTVHAHDTEEAPQPAAPQPSINVSVNTGAGQEQPISVGNWLLTFIVMCIPPINVIMLLVWAFGGSAHKSKSNWARAALLMMLIAAVGWLIFSVLLAAAFRSAF